MASCCSGGNGFAQEKCPARHMPVVTCALPYPQSALAQSTNLKLPKSPYQSNDGSTLPACPMITCKLAWLNDDSWVMMPSKICGGTLPPPARCGSGNSSCGV